MQLHSGQLVCFKQLLLLGSLSSTLSMFISDIRGDAIAVVDLFFHVPMLNINIFGISKTCFAIVGSPSVSEND